MMKTLTKLKNKFQTDNEISDGVRLLRFTSKDKNKPDFWCIATFDEKLEAWDCRMTYNTKKEAENGILDFTIYTEQEYKNLARRINDQTKMR
jgi:hypothetical protein